MARISLSGTVPGERAPGSGPSDTLRDQARQHSRWVARGARAGYAAKGIVYLVIGALAVRAAMGAGGRTTDARGALRTIAQGPGEWMLVLMGIGLLAYSLWAVLAAILDADDRGHEPKGIALRVGQAGRGIAYGALGVAALRIANHSPDAGEGGAQGWSARLLSMPAGRWLLAAIGLGVIAYATYQFWRGAKKDLAKRLHLAQASAETGAGTAQWVVRLARFGIIARGVVFLLIGWFLVQAGLRRDAARVGGIDESLATLYGASYGPLLLGVVAVGLMAYGVWELANARYREIRVA